MVRRNRGEKSKGTTQQVCNASSVRDRIRRAEIDLKITNVVEKLRGPNSTIISRAVTLCAEKLLARNPKMINFVGGGHRYTFAQASWVCRTQVEADFLRDYLQGVTQIFNGYFSRRQMKLGSIELREVWAKEIEPLWKGMLLTLEDELKGNYPGNDPSILQSRMSEFQERAGRTLKEAANEWHEKVEEAVSDETFGQHHLEIAPVGKSTRESDDTAVSPLAVPPGAKWEDLCIMMSEHAMHVEVKGKAADRTFQEAGFEEKRRREVPDRLWRILRVLAIVGGVLPFDEPKLSLRDRVNIKQNVSQIRKRLKDLFPTDGDPFEPTRKTRQYISRFKISTSEGLLFPTPGDTTWDKVTIEEVQSGRIRFSVDTFQRSSALSYDEEEGVAGPEAALRESNIERDYDLRSLGLAMQDGSPNPRGSALLAVLRSAGKVRRPSNDEAMLWLGKFLCDFMELREPPFQFSENQGFWITTFEASSHISPDRR
jgi:hypothetical protein